MSESTVGPGPIPSCPRCPGAHVVRDGSSASGTPTFRCRGCGRRFVADPEKGPVGPEGQARVRRRVAERLGVRAIARATGRARSWVRKFVDAVYRGHTPHDPGPPPDKSARP